MPSKWWTELAARAGPAVGGPAEVITAEYHNTQSRSILAHSQRLSVSGMVDLSPFAAALASTCEPLARATEMRVFSMAGRSMPSPAPTVTHRPRSPTPIPIAGQATPYAPDHQGYRAPEA